VDRSCNGSCNIRLKTKARLSATRPAFSARRPGICKTARRPRGSDIRRVCVCRAATDRSRPSRVGLARRKRRRGIVSGPIGRVPASWASLPCAPLASAKMAQHRRRKNLEKLFRLLISSPIRTGGIRPRTQQALPEIIPSRACWLCCYLNANLIGRDNRPFGRNHHTGRYRIGQALATTFEA
jgi:hypothetical protein